MITGMIILILLLPVTGISLAVDTLFSATELWDMGISLENPQPADLLPAVSDKTTECLACLASGLPS